MQTKKAALAIGILFLCISMPAFCQDPVPANGFLWETGAVPDALTADPRMRDIYQAEGFQVVVDRTHARPGERYIEVLLVLDTEPDQGAQWAWTAEVFDVSVNRLLTSARSDVRARRTSLSADLRRHAVRNGRLRAVRRWTQALSGAGIGRTGRYRRGTARGRGHGRLGCVLGPGRWSAGLVPLCRAAAPQRNRGGTRASRTAAV